MCYSVEVLIIEGSSPKNEISVIIYNYSHVVYFLLFVFLVYAMNVSVNFDPIDFQCVGYRQQQIQSKYICLPSTKRCKVKVNDDIIKNLVNYYM